MSAGIVLERVFGPVTRTDLVRYAGAGGDFNPIHHDEAFAQAAGYPSVFAHGLYTAGLAGAALAEAVGPLTLRRFAVRYVGQVWPGDTISVTVRET
ncbi:MAG: MaoC/PaaZ C-terminal domain-containing protein, partial [Humibacter sp.]